MYIHTQAYKKSNKFDKKKPKQIYFTKVLDTHKYSPTLL